MKKNNILFLDRQEIDVVKYDICIGDATNSLPYASSFYLDALCEDWSALIIGDYEMVMPLPIRKKYGITYVYPPFFMQQLGIFSEKQIEAEIVHAFIKHIPQKIRFIQTNFNYANPIIEDGVQKTNLILRLDQPYEAIIKSYSKTLQRNLNKALQMTLTFEETDKKAAFISFYKKHTLSKTSVIKKKDIGKLSSLVDALFEKKIAKIFVVKSGSIWLSATLFLITNKRIINLLVANSDASKETNSSARLLDNVISLYADQKIIFDFEGSELPGVSRFYRSFGAEEQVYFQYTENKLPALFKWLKS